MRRLSLWLFTFILLSSTILMGCVQSPSTSPTPAVDAGQIYINHAKAILSAYQLSGEIWIDICDSSCDVVISADKLEDYPWVKIKEIIAKLDDPSLSEGHFVPNVIIISETVIFSRDANTGDISANYTHSLFP